MRLLTVLAAFCTLFVTAVLAALTAYVLDRAKTIVAYEVSFGNGAPIKGRFHVVSADTIGKSAGRPSV